MLTASHSVECLRTPNGVRCAARSIGEFLRSEGVEEQQRMEWELAIVEAGNNSVQRSKEDCPMAATRVRFVAAVNDQQVRVGVWDRSVSSDRNLEVRPSNRKEQKGLSFIAQFTDWVRYFRAPGQNFLVMGKSRM